jgi:hypothetical protein
MTTDSRPLYRPEVRWLTGDAAIPPLDVRTVDRHFQVAESVVQQCAEWIERSTNLSPDHILVTDHEMTGAYAAGVAEVLDWLRGSDPSPGLVDLLDLPTPKGEAR